jgi:hypothetical protein
MTLQTAQPHHFKVENSVVVKAVGCPKTCDVTLLKNAIEMMCQDEEQVE